MAGKETARPPKDLTKFDLTVLVDASGSMEMNQSTVVNGSLWQEIQEAAMALVNKCIKIDTNGVEVIFFHDDAEAPQTITDAAQIKPQFDAIGTGGTTNLTGALATAWDLHQSKKQSGQIGGTGKKGSLNIVITDGEANNPAGVVQQIKTIAEGIASDEEFTILFVQVGQDAEAEKFLVKLDNDLQSGLKLPFDIVDTKTFKDLRGGTVQDTLLAAIRD